MGAEDKDFVAVSQTGLTRVQLRLQHRLNTEVSVTSEEGIKVCKTHMRIISTCIFMKSTKIWK